MLRAILCSVWKWSVKLLSRVFHSYTNLSKQWDNRADRVESSGPLRPTCSVEQAWVKGRLSVRGPTRAYCPCGRGFAVLPPLELAQCFCLRRRLRGQPPALIFQTALLPAMASSLLLLDCAAFPRTKPFGAATLTLRSLSFTSHWTTPGCLWRVFVECFCATSWNLRSSNGPNPVLKVSVVGPFAIHFSHVTNVLFDSRPCGRHC